jgi:hypothetical protein
MQTSGFTCDVRREIVCSPSRKGVVFHRLFRVHLWVKFSVTNKREFQINILLRKVQYTVIDDICGGGGMLILSTIPLRYRRGNYQSYHCNHEKQIQQDAQIS